jgi:hypothetical protein
MGANNPAASFCSLLGGALGFYQFSVSEFHVGSLLSLQFYFAECLGSVFELVVDSWPSENSPLTFVGAEPE